MDEFVIGWMESNLFEIEMMNGERCTYGQSSGWMDRTSSQKYGNLDEWKIYFDISSGLEEQHAGTMEAG